MDGGREWLEAIIKRKAYEDSPVKVIEVETVDSGIGKGENYLSKIGRIKAKVLLGSGRVKTLSFVLKNQHETEHMKKFSTESGVFFREIIMYRDILPKMQDLLEEIGDPEGIFWAKCYDIRLYDRLMFEDLSALGYRMADRKKQLGLDAGLLVIRQLAKFHALSRILITRGEIPMDLFKSHAIFKNREESIKGFNGNVKNIIKAMEKWGDGWEEAIERFKNAENFAERTLDAYTVEPDDFTVLCHADCWTNNILFSGDDLEHPKSVRFLDLQVCFVNSPVKDLAFFINTSIRLDVRERNFDLFLQTYCDALKTSLLKYGYDGAIPDVDFIKKEISRKSLIELADALFFIPLVLLHSEHAQDIEESVQQAKDAANDPNVDASEFFNPMKNMSLDCEKALKALVKRALLNGTI